MIATLLIGALAIAQPHCAWEPLRFALTPGSKLTYKTKSLSEFTIDDSVFITTIEEVRRVEAVEVIDGWTRIKSTVAEHNLTTTYPHGDKTNALGLVTSLLVSPTRRQKEWKVVANGAMTASQVNVLSGYSKDDMESGFEGLMFPESAAAVGVTWAVEHAPAGVDVSGMPATTTGKVKTTYKVLEVKDGNAVIEAMTAGTFQRSIHRPDGELKMEVKLEQTSKFTVRATDGVVVKAETRIRQTMSTMFGEFTSGATNTTELVKV